MEILMAAFYYSIVSNQANKASLKFMIMSGLKNLEKLKSKKQIPKEM